MCKGCGARYGNWADRTAPALAPAPVELVLVEYVGNSTHPQFGKATGALYDFEAEPIRYVDKRDRDNLRNVRDV